MDPSLEIQSVKLPIHNPPLHPSSRFIKSRCHSCGVQSCFYGGYRCNDYECVHVWFHKECAESPQDINHPSHPNHPLELIHSSSRMHCDLCIKNFGHHVSIVVQYVLSSTLIQDVRQTYHIDHQMLLLKIPRHMTIHLISPWKRGFKKLVKLSIRPVMLWIFIAVFNVMYISIRNLSTNQ